LRAEGIGIASTAAVEVPVLLAERQTTSRLAALDTARGLAIVGMVVHHSAQCLKSAQPAGLADWMVSVIGGIPTGLFLLLAGIGIGFLGRTAARFGIPARAILWPRARFLLVIGIVNMLAWPYDILRLYGLVMLLAPWMLRASPRSLGLAGVAIVALQQVLLYLVAPSDHDWGEGTPSTEIPWLWLTGLLLDGARPLLPWAALIFLGLGLSRLDLGSPAVRIRLLVCGALLTVLAHAVAAMAELALPQEDPLLRISWGTRDDPATPFFVLSVAGWAMVLLALSMASWVRWPRSRLLAALGDTGRLSLTWYVAHVWFLSWLEDGLEVEVPTGWTLLIALGLSLVMIWASVRWSRRADRGPFEALLRRTPHVR